MAIHRIVPNLTVADAATGHDFYGGLLGLQKAFDLGWVVSYQSPDNNRVQVSLVSGDPTAPEESVMTVDVSDIDRVWSRAREDGFEIVHPLTTETWGVRRFFVRDPHGYVVSVARAD